MQTEAATDGSTAMLVTCAARMWVSLALVAMLTLVWLYLEYAYALIVRRTGSLWGPVLAHAIADLRSLLITFGTRQAL